MNDGVLLLETSTRNPIRDLRMLDLIKTIKRKTIKPKVVYFK